jgi:hypothetical protein
MSTQRLEPLDSSSRELLDAARGGHRSPAGSRNRVRARLAASLGVSVFLSTASVAKAAWLTIGAVLVAVSVSTAGYVALRRQPNVTVSPAVAPAVAPRSDPVATPEEVGSPPAAVPDPVVTAAQVPFLPPPPRAVTVARPAKVPDPPAAGPAIGEEAALLLSTQAALREDNPGRALALLDEHARRFPRGALAQERDAARVLALCAAGRVDEARSARDAFLAAHPRSPAAARVRHACGGP